MHLVPLCQVVLVLARIAANVVALPTKSASPIWEPAGLRANLNSPDAILRALQLSAEKENIAEELAALPETDPLRWLLAAKVEVKKHLETKVSRSRAKNVILFLGDGMSVSTITAARILKGQKAGFTGEEHKLSFESFPFTGLSKTYCVDKQVADSASTATAYFTGVKTNYGMLGVGPGVTRGDCKAMNQPENQLSSIATWAQEDGKVAGLVTTTRVTHASPAGMYAHVADRGWESDADVIKDKLNPQDCEDIASQLVTKLPGMDLRVILGGGRSEFLPKSVVDEDGKAGKRKDGRNLIDLWKFIRKTNSQKYEYVTSKPALLELAPTAEYLLGLFNSSHLPYSDDLPHDKPTLAEMTAAALKVLSKNERGYFLFVEGGRIDHGHHKTQAQRALVETIGFSDAIETALGITDPEETLIVVTADHGHTMTISGYPKRGSNILGLAEVSEEDGLPYTTLSYANGPNANYTLKGHGICSRVDLSSADITGNKDQMYPGTVPLHMETHDGSDVAVYATGPRSFMFSGNYEQNYIPVAMAYAACIGPYAKDCS